MTHHSVINPRLLPNLRPLSPAVSTLPGTSLGYLAVKEEWKKEKKEEQQELPPVEEAEAAAAAVVTPAAA